MSPDHEGDEERRDETEHGDTLGPEDSEVAYGKLKKAAIEAELETGKREATFQKAHRNVLLRFGQIAFGGLVTLIGLLLLVLPGPGLLVVAIGLGILAPEVPFARRLLDRVRKRLPEDEDGKIPANVIILMIFGAVVFTALSLWWTLGRS